MMPEKIRARLRDGLLPRGEAIRHQVKQLDQQRERAFREEKRAAPRAAPKTLEIRNGGIRVATVQGNLVTGSMVIAPVERPMIAPVVVENDIKPLISLMVGRYVPGMRYVFKFYGTNEENFVQIDDAVLVEIKRKNQDLGRWVSAFMAGRAAQQGAGIKQLQSVRGDVWEIKSPAVGFRIIVSQDKETKIWRWRGLVSHDRVDQFLRAQKL